MHTNRLFLIGLALMLLAGCGGSPDNQQQASEQEEEIQAFREHLDSLETVALAQISDLESKLEGLVAEDSAAIQREITYLREIHDDIVTEKDNLKVVRQEKWRSFRETLEKNINAIERRVNRTQ